MLTAMTERRAGFRAHLGPADRVPVSFETQDGRTLQGYVCDISAGGLSAVFAPPTAVLPQGELIPCCVIRFAPDDEVSSALEVRFVYTEAHSGQWRVGGSYIEMERAQQHRVERFVAVK